MMLLLTGLRNWADIHEKVCFPKLVEKLPVRKTECQYLDDNVFNHVKTM